MRERREYYGGKKGRVGMGGKGVIRWKKKMGVERRAKGKRGRAKEEARRTVRSVRQAGQLIRGWRQTGRCRAKPCMPNKQTITAHSMKHAEGRKDEGAKGILWGKERKGGNGGKEGD